MNSETRAESDDLPEPSFKIYKDGDQFCAITVGFKNLQESTAGFGYTPIEALKELLDMSR